MAILPRVLALHAAGRTTHEIASAVHKSKDTVRRYIREYADDPPPAWCEDYWNPPKFVPLTDDRGRRVYRGNVTTYAEAVPRTSRRGVQCEPLTLLQWGR